MADRGVRQPLQLAEGQREALTLGKPLCHLPDQPAQVGDLQGRLGVAVPVAVDQPQHRLLGVVSAALDVLALASPPAELVVTEVDRDPVDPGAEVVRGVHPVQGLDDVEERLLDEVLGRLGVTQVAQAQVADALVVAAEEAVEGSRISTAVRIDQGEIAWLVAHSSPRSGPPA